MYRPRRTRRSHPWSAQLASFRAAAGALIPSSLATSRGAMNRRRPATAANSARPERDMPRDDIRSPVIQPRMELSASGYQALDTEKPLVWTLAELSVLRCRTRSPGIQTGGWVSGVRSRARRRSPASLARAYECWDLGCAGQQARHAKRRALSVGLVPRPNRVVAPCRQKRSICRQFTSRRGVSNP